MLRCSTDEGRKRVLAIVAGILVARHLKTTDDLFDSRVKPEDRIVGRRRAPVGGADHEGKLVACFRSRPEVVVQVP